MFFNYRPLKLNKKKWLRSPAKSYKGGYFFDKNNLPSPWTTFLTNPYVFSLLLDPFFIQCKGPQCQLMWLVQLKEVVFTLCLYEDIICFIQKTALTYFLSKKYESRVVVRRSCSVLVPLHERICHRGKSNFSRVTGGLITATIPVPVGKIFIHSSDFTEWQKGRIFPGLLRSIYSLSWWSPIVTFSFGGPYD